MDKNAKNLPDQLKDALHKFSQGLLWKIKPREAYYIRLFENSIPYLQKFSVAIMVHLFRDKSSWQTRVKKKEQVNTGILSVLCN